MHHDADTDRLGGLLLGGSGADRRFSVGGDTAVASVHHPDRHRYQLFVLRVEGAGCHGRFAHLAESGVHAGDHLTQRTMLRVEVAENVVVTVLLIHDHSVYQYR